jgi:3-oxoacyl-[acyl-carrier-protein] synthase II
LSKRRVAVTGLGIVSPVGSTVDAAWASICEGRSGIDRITRFDAAAFPSRIAGEVRGFDASRYIAGKELRPNETFG